MPRKRELEEQLASAVERGNALEARRLAEVEALQEQVRQLKEQVAPIREMLAQAGALLRAWHKVDEYSAERFNALRLAEKIEGAA